MLLCSTLFCQVLVLIIRLITLSDYVITILQLPRLHTYISIVMKNNENFLTKQENFNKACV